MYAVEVRDRIMIAHSLPDPFFGPAQHMHGATFVVDVAFFREQLTAQNVVVDIGAALDVLGGSAGGVNPRLLALPRASKVLLTAHMASATLEARVEMGETVIVNIRAFVDGHQPPHRVLPDLTARAARG